jgi:chaperonin GroES
MLKFKPLGNHIFVKPRSSQKQVGSIILPDNATMEQRIGTVHAVGVGVWRGSSFVPTEIKVGDTVVFGQYSGQRMEFTVLKDGMAVVDEYYHMREDEIYCVIDNPEDIIAVEDVVS